MSSSFSHTVDSTSGALSTLSFDRRFEFIGPPTLETFQWRTKLLSAVITWHSPATPKAGSQQVHAFCMPRFERSPSVHAARI